MFYQELSADERKAKKKPGPKPTPADKISAEDERNTCLDKLPYLREMIEGLPQSFSENYSDWIKVIWALGNIRKGRKQEVKKDILKIAINFCKRSKRANHQLSDDEHKSNIRERWGDLSSSGNLLKIGSIWKWLQDTNKTLFNRLQKIIHNDKYQTKGSKYNTKVFQELPNYTEQKAYWEAHHVFIRKKGMIYQTSPIVDPLYTIPELKSNSDNLYAKVISEEEVDGQMTQVMRKTKFVKTGCVNICQI